MTSHHLFVSTERRLSHTVKVILSDTKAKGYFKHRLPIFLSLEKTVKFSLKLILISQKRSSRPACLCNSKSRNYKFSFQKKKKTQLGNYSNLAASFSFLI